MSRAEFYMLRLALQTGLLWLIGIMGGRAVQVWDDPVRMELVIQYSDGRE